MGMFAGSAHVARAVDGLRRATFYMCMRLYMLDYTCTHAHVEVRKDKNGWKCCRRCVSAVPCACVACCERVCRGRQGGKAHGMRVCGVIEGLTDG